MVAEPPVGDVPNSDLADIHVFASVSVAVEVLILTLGTVVHLHKHGFVVRETFQCVNEFSFSHNVSFIINSDHDRVGSCVYALFLLLKNVLLRSNP